MSDTSLFLARLDECPFRTSYKFYFSMSLVELGKTKEILNYHEIAVTMLSFAWNDISNYPDSFTHFDMLPRLKKQAQELCHLDEVDSEEYIRLNLARITDETFVMNLNRLLDYIPCVFLDRKELSSLWKRMTHNEKMKQIKMYSHSSDYFYEVTDKAIILHPIFFHSVGDCDNTLAEIKERITKYLSRGDEE